MIKRVCLKDDYCQLQRMADHRHYKLKICIKNDPKCEYTAEYIVVKAEDIEDVNKED